jgi:FkbM family methyltransferase
MSTVKGISYFLSRYILRKQFLNAYIPSYDLNIRFKTEDAVGRRLYKKADYEPHLTSFVEKNFKLKANQVALDIGANLGWYSMLLDRISEEGASIHSFEPDPLNFNLLKTNLSQNNVTKVQITETALSDSSGEQTLHLYPDKNRGRHSLLPINDGETVTVKTLTLDDYCEQNAISGESIEFIKIDVEGYEPMVLQGGKKTLSTCPVILSEFAPEYMNKGNLSVEEYLNMMYGFGYRSLRITPEGIDEVDSKFLLGTEENHDIIWSKELLNLD